MQFKNAPAGATAESEDDPRVAELEQFLRYLDERVHMTPKLRAATYIDKGLDLVVDPKYRFPAHAVELAAALRQKWENQNWGAQAGEDPTGATTTAPALAAHPVAAHGNARIQRQQIDHLPPPDHPIYGERGIMHGVIMDKSAAYGPDGSHRRTVYRRHPAYTPKDAHVFGHNGLEVGRWWPQQLPALFHGAHGSSQGGIAGSAKAGGAYSIVASGGNAHYGRLDDDRGDVIYYSGSRSHANRDPDNFADPPSPFTLALEASLKSRNPVRVLRSAAVNAGRDKTSKWAPSVGIRYDGLYRVVAMEAATNAYGGLYERFELRRLPGQTPLEELRKTSPTAQQRRDYHKIGEGY